MRTYTAGLTATFPEVTRYTGGKLSVVAVDGPARDSAARGDGLTPIRSITLRL